MIGRDPIFQGQRTAGDLRDRFRNAFREEYESAVQKSRQNRKAGGGSSRSSGAPPEGSAPASASASSNTSVSGGEWSLSDAASDGNLTDHSSFSQQDQNGAADIQRESEVGPKRRKASTRSARKSESGFSDSSSRASSFSHPNRPMLMTSASAGQAEALPVTTLSAQQEQLLSVPQSLEQQPSQDAAEQFEAQPGKLRRSQSTKRAHPRISDREFGRFSPSMMLNTARGSAHPLIEGNLASQTGGGGFPWLSATQMQIAMQLQAQMSGSALYLGDGEGHGEENDEDGEYDPEEEEEEEQAQQVTDSTDTDALFSAPTVMQKALEDLEMDGPLDVRLDPNMGFDRLPGLPNFFAHDVGDLPNLFSDVDLDPGILQDFRHSQIAGDLHSWQNGSASLQAPGEAYAQNGEHNLQRMGLDTWEAVQQALASGQGFGDVKAQDFSRSASDFSSEVPPLDASLQPVHPSRRSTDTLRDQAGVMQPALDLTNSSTFDDRGFDPAVLEEWLDNQADLGPGAPS